MKRKLKSATFPGRDQIENLYIYNDASFTYGSTGQGNDGYTISEVDTKRSIVLPMYRGGWVREQLTGTGRNYVQALHLSSPTNVECYGFLTYSAGTFPLPFAVIEFKELIANVQRGLASFTCSVAGGWNTESITVSTVRDTLKCLPIIAFTTYDEPSGAGEIVSMYPKMGSTTLLNVYAHNQVEANTVVNFGWQLIEFM